MPLFFVSLSDKNECGKGTYFDRGVGCTIAVEGWIKSLHLSSSLNLHSLYIPVFTVYSCIHCIPFAVFRSVFSQRRGSDDLCMRGCIVSWGN